MPRFSLLMAAAGIGLLFVCRATATTYYVSNTSGSDQNDGLSATTPWASIRMANATLRAGDTVLIRTGTYHEIIEPYQSGAPGAPITYKNYRGETVVVRGVYGKSCVVALGRSFYGPGGARSYIVVDGLTIRHVDPFHMEHDPRVGGIPRPVLVSLSGTDSRFNVIRNCQIQGQGSAVWDGGVETGIGISAGSYNTLENNQIAGLCRLGIYLNQAARYNTIRGNTITRTYGSNINLGSSKGLMQGNLIEGNRLDGSLVEDGIQFEHRYDLPAGIVDVDSNRGVVIRGNVICNNAENAIDLKGAAYVVIEDNVLYGVYGNNDGGLRPDVGDRRYPGAGMITHGTGPGSRNVIIRRNVLYDGPGGILPENYYKVYHNTVVYNNRDYTGSNSHWTTTNKPAFVGISAWSGQTGVSLKNNILGGHRSADLALGRRASGLDIDGNLYFNSPRALLVDFRDSSDWRLVPFSRWSTFLSTQGGIVGAEVHSREASPLFVNVPAHPSGPSEAYDFNLQPGSPAIDQGAFLTQTTAAGQGTTLHVKDAGYFYDGYGITGGDIIQLQGQDMTARLVSVDYSANMLVVDRSLSWTADQGVSLPYRGVAPDIGAREYTGTR